MPTDTERIAWLEQQLATLTARVHHLEQPSIRTLPTPLAASEVPRLMPPAVVATPLAPAAPADPANADALEAKLGTYWLSRIGIVSLITGVALLVVTYFGELGPFVRVALGYAMAGALGWLGLRIARRHETFGRLVFGGGLAIGYFVTYALHFVSAMRVIDSEVIGIALVASAIAAIVVTAHRMKSETVAGIALFLGLHTGLLSDVTALSLVCTTLLAAGAGFFLFANRWVIVPLSTVFAVYTTHASLAFGHAGLAPDVQLSFLAVDFALFSLASLGRAGGRENWLVLLAALNWIGVMTLGANSLAAVSAGAVFGFLCAFAAAHLLLAGASRLRGLPPSVIGVQLALAMITLAIALPVELDHWALLAAGSALAVVGAALGRWSPWPAFRWFAIALLACAHGVAYVRIGEPAAAAVALAITFAIERACASSRTWPGERIVLVIGVAMSALAMVELWIPTAATLGWLGAAAALFAAGFALSARPYRVAGLAALAATALRFLCGELPTASAGTRIATFVAAGALLLVVSFLYTRRHATRREP